MMDLSKPVSQLSEVGYMASLSVLLRNEKILGVCLAVLKCPYLMGNKVILDLCRLVYIVHSCEPSEKTNCV